MKATSIIVKGDPDAIHRVWRDELLPVAEPLAAEYGWLRSVVAKDDESVVILNLWRDAEGLQRAFADPQIDAVQRERLGPLASEPPDIRVLEVLEDLTF